MTRLAEIAQINPRTAPELNDGDQVSFLGMADVSENGATSRGQDRQVSEVRKGFTSFLDGDLLVAKITPCFENGKIAQASLKHRVGFGSTEFHVVRAHPEHADARYLLHFLRSSGVRESGERRMTGSAGQRRVPKDFLESLDVPLPPLPEQRRIASIFDQADELRVLRRRAIARLDRLPDLIYENLTRGGRIPWTRTPLSEVVPAGDRINYGVVQPGEHFPGGRAIVRAGDIQDGEVSHERLKLIDPAIETKHSRSRLVGNEILITCVGSIGNVAVVGVAEVGMNIVRAVARVPVSEHFEREFLAAAIRSPQVQAYFKMELRTVSQPTLNIKQISETLIPVAPLEVQRDFADRAVAIGRLVADHRAHLKKLDALFETLLSQSFGQTP